MMDENNNNTGWALPDKLVALVAAMLMGTLVHFASRLMGLEVTTPGVIFATAMVAVTFSAIHWK